MLSSSPASLLQAKMVTLPTFEGLSIFHSLRPPTPVKCLTVYNSGGDVQGRRMTDGKTTIFPNIQIIARGTEEESWALASLVLAWTDEVAGLVLEPDVSLKNIKKLTTILNMGIEDKTKAQLYSLNLQLTIDS